MEEGSLFGGEVLDSPSSTNFLFVHEDKDKTSTSISGVIPAICCCCASTMQRAVAGFTTGSWCAPSPVAEGPAEG